MLVAIPELQTPPKLTIDQEVKLQQIANQFKVGEILKAVVVSGIGESKLMLNIDGKNINAQTNHPFKMGEQLTVEVQQQAGKTVLQVQSRTPSIHIISQALRQVLPNQMQATQLLTTLQSLVSSEKLALPAQVSQQISQLLNQIPSSQSLTNPLELKQLFQNAGNFLEAKLAATAQNQPQTVALQTDFKAQLYQLLQTINQAIPNQTKNAGSESQHIAKEIAQLLGNNLKQWSTLTRPETKQLEQAARLKRAANMIRSQNAPQARLPLPQQHNQTAHATNSNKSDTSYLKQAPLPLKGAVPQPPISTPNQISPSLLPKEQLLPLLQKETTGTLARIQAQQLSAIPQDNQPTSSYLLDVPVVLPDKQMSIIPFLIEEPESSTNEEKKHWSISLALDLENLGPMQLKVSYTGQHINVNIWSEQSKTTQMLTEHSEQLTQALDQANLKVGQLIYSTQLQENDIDPTLISLLDLSI